MKYCFTYDSSDDFTDSDSWESNENASRESVWSDSTYNFFAALSRSIHLSAELLPKLLDVSILQTASVPEGPDHLLYTPVFRMTSAFMHSYFLLCMECSISSNKKCLSASLWHGCFCFKWLRVVSFRRNTQLSMLFERNFMALLILLLIVCPTNFLDSCAIDFGLVEPFSSFWIVSFSLNSSSKSLDCHRIVLGRSASGTSFASELRLGFYSMRDGITIIALIVICFIAESCIHAFNNCVISGT